MERRESFGLPPRFSIFQILTHMATTHSKQWALINGVLCGVIGGAIDCLVGQACGEQVIETIGQLWKPAEEPAEADSEAISLEQTGGINEIRV